MFQQKDIRRKIALAEEFCHRALLGVVPEIPLEPARGVEVRPRRSLTRKQGLSSLAGQARLLHDLANIELQAMELGLRTLSEYLEAPMEFREELAKITVEESKHLEMCLEGLQRLGFSWGDWPIHLDLWKSVSTKDSLLDRILIVHRYLEGSGLDAGEAILRKLSGVKGNQVKDVVETITHEEIAHVEFGSRWYREMCRIERVDAAEDFMPRLRSLFERLPKRGAKVDREVRLKAGFTDKEVKDLAGFQEQFFKSLQ